MKLKLLFAFMCIINLSYAQKNEKAHIPSQRAQSVYGELGGNGILFSANYDVRFANSQKGLGARIGIGGLANYLTIPFAFNYLAGKAPNYFEGGLGITYATDAQATSDHGTAIVFSSGYRYQPLKNGFTARVVLSPFVATDGEGFFFFGGVSLGYKF
jgi:hypothetical protein